MLDFGNLFCPAIEDSRIYDVFSVEPRDLIPTDSGLNVTIGSLIYKENGLELIFGQSKSPQQTVILNAIWLLTDRVEKGTTTYNGTMPQGLAFNQSTDSVKAKLGPPLLEGGEKTHILFGNILPHVVYNFPTQYRMNCAFDDMGLKEICISPAEV